MQITPYVNLPDALVTAQRSGRLVIFAGAGVSVDAPSSLPNFHQLAEQVGAGAPPEGEPIDRFLGRLRTRGVEVHRRVQRLLSPEASRPTPLHHDLLRLFRKPEMVRLVTTNFDNHFSSASKELWNRTPQIYTTPALPLGDDYHGIVHLHGSTVVSPPEHMILTDEDFGLAYITKGWVSRFLVDLFRAYTVLFVGYSHGDPVMQYLARAIAPSGQRFSLVPEDDSSGFWAHLRIQAIPYPSQDPSSPHAELGRAVTAWADRAASGAIDTDRQIRDLVAGGVPLDPVDHDHLADALTDASTVQSFVRYATDTSWLEWVSKQPKFQALFDEADLDEIGNTLAAWFAGTFARSHADEALAVVARLGPTINRVLWVELVQSLTWGDDGSSDGSPISRWLALLLQHRPSALPHLTLELVPRSCKLPRDEVALILLFEFLTRPQLILDDRFSQIGQPLRADCVVRSERRHLAESWEQQFKPHLDQIAPPLLPVVTRHLSHAYRLLQSCSINERTIDWTSLGRSAIEPHEQDEYPQTIDVLIDAARDIGAWYAAQSRAGVDMLLNLWYNDTPLLQRLAIHILHVSPYHTADEKLDWVLTRELLFKPEVKHELFELVRAAYPQASDEIRQCVVGAARRGPPQRPAAGQGEETRTRSAAYETFNLLAWLQSAAPDEPRVNQALRDVKSKHPTFEIREYPDLDFYVTDGGWMEPKSLVTEDELIEMNVDDRADWLLGRVARSGWYVPEREGLRTTVEAATKRSTRWSRSLVDLLRREEEWGSDLWEPILRGWRKGVLSAEDWSFVLEMIEAEPALDAQVPAVLRLLLDAVRRDVLPSRDFLERVEDLTLRLHDRAQQIDPKRDTVKILNARTGEARIDWLQQSMMHTAGGVVEIWLHCLARRRKDAGEEWRVLPEHHAAFYERIVKGVTANDRMGIPMLGSQLLFVFSCDEDWTERHLLQIYDWERDECMAELAWHGYLAWGRWNETLLRRLRPLYRQTMSYVARLGVGKERFTRHVADVAVFGQSSPTDDRWLDEFIEKADRSQRLAWAGRMSFLLGSLDEDARVDLWRRWLRAYWRNRQDGIPVALEQKEMEVMVTKWTMLLGPVFRDAVDVVCRTPYMASSGHTLLWWEWAELPLAAEEAQSTARFVNHVLKGCEPPFRNCEDIEKFLRTLRGGGAEGSVMRSICEEMARLGCGNAEVLQRTLGVDGKT